MATKPISGRMLGHYRLMERIGEGGMGVVYRGYDEHLQREIALKLLPANIVRDESARRRFRKEALTLARLNHPNIGTLHGFEADGDVDFLVMEYVPGINLASRLARGPLRESELLAVASALVSLALYRRVEPTRPQRRRWLLGLAALFVALAGLGLIIGR